jgi:hypothetical protein
LLPAALCLIACGVGVFLILFAFAALAVCALAVVPLLEMLVVY